MAETNGETGGDARFIRRVLILLGIIALAAALITLKDLLLLVFGSVVIAVLLSAICNPVARWLKLPRGIALTIAILFVLAVIAGAGALFGLQVARQAEQISTSAPAAWERARQEASEWGLELPRLPRAMQSGPPTSAGEAQRGGEAEAAEDSEAPQEEEPGLAGIGEAIASRVGNLLTTTFGALANTLLVLAGGVYLAAQPQLYRTGVLKLFARRKRPLIEKTYDECGKALKLWLLGTLVSMIVVGTFTALGLWLLGVQSWLALGLLAGLLEFVPIIGPIAASIPAVLLAFTESFELALATAALFLVVQQLEGNVLQPIVQRYAVDLPPALLLFSVVAGGTLFGFIGILFAAPLTVTAFVLVKRLYVREVLHTDTPMPHE
jgi:predicted PurR-regulated permease PerM